MGEEAETEEELGVLMFPSRVAIDDACDGCGATSGLAAAYGADKPVICLGCLRNGLALFNRRAS